MQQGTKEDKGLAGLSTRTDALARPLEPVLHLREGIACYENAMSEAMKVKLQSPSGDTIEVEWTRERLLVFMTSENSMPGRGSITAAYDSHVAKLIEQEAVSQFEM